MFSPCIVFPTLWNTHGIVVVSLPDAFGRMMHPAAVYPNGVWCFPFFG